MRSCGSGAFVGRNIALFGREVGSIDTYQICLSWIAPASQSSS